jgi:hypothetical protein
MRIRTEILAGVVMLSGLGAAASAQAQDPSAEDATASEATAGPAENTKRLERMEASAGAVGKALDDLGAALERARAGSQAAPGEADPNLVALLAHRRNMEALRHGPGAEGGAVAIAVPLGFFAMLFGLVFVPLLLRHRRRRIEADLQARAIDAGMQFVPELPARPLPLRNDKRTGALLAGLGIAFALPTALAGATPVAVFGLAPVVLGLAYVLIGFFLPAPAGK